MPQIFKPGPTDYLNQPMFFGAPVSTARYDEQTFPELERLISRQLAFFWRPEEINVTQDRIDYENLSDADRHIFVSNLKYQTLLDSIQGRSPVLAYLELCSVPEAETWIETWAFSETIHSRSYTHILRNIVNDPSIILKDITVNPAITKRAKIYAEAYEDLIQANTQLRMLIHQHELEGKEFDYQTFQGGKVFRQHVHLLYRSLSATNALEAIAFYVSFACSFAFGKRGIMTGNAAIIKLISRDEALHQRGTEWMLNTLRKAGGVYTEVWEENKQEYFDLFLAAAESEEDWADELFAEGDSLGLNKTILCQFVRYITNVRISQLGAPLPFPDQLENPLPWLYTEGWLAGESQVAPQEKENTKYLTGDLNTQVTDEDIMGLDFD